MTTETLRTDPAPLQAEGRKPEFVLQTFIRCSVDALWEALTDPQQMAAYHFIAAEIRKDGDVYRHFFDGGAPMLDCRTVETEPKTRIVTTFEPRWEGGGAPSTCIYRIAPEGDHCALTLEHYDLTFPAVPGEGVADGWARWASGLKTYLETGEAARFGHAPAA